MAKLDSGPRFSGDDKDRSVSLPNLVESSGKNIYDALSSFNNLLGLEELAALRDSLNDSTANDRAVGPWSPLAWSLKGPNDSRGKPQQGLVLFGGLSDRGGVFCLLWRNGLFDVITRPGTDGWKAHYRAALRS